LVWKKEYKKETKDVGNILILEITLKNLKVEVNDIIKKIKGFENLV